ncbi:substrate-binding domain-containing protein [Luteolibacter sp. SL250]|uniref:AraC family transcriptional regulator n=1 Tax=Luteolibacter sp. SL250 TaxID=2995170 RepID=UPI00226E09FE|nr:substrate-binding domain-containing protein [Luteolibacter sp. SL250]WAC19716.1 substrate-binding domain-containing protein [Luteolibacter sp. SL250]
MSQIARVVRIGLLLHQETGYGRSILRGIINYGKYQPSWELIDGGPPSAAGLEDLLQAQVDAVIAEVRDPALMELCRLKVKVLVTVASGTRPLAGSHWGGVSTDNNGVGRMAFSFYHARGFRHLAFLGSPGRPYSDLRLQGFRDAATAHGLRVTLPPHAPDGTLPREELVRWLSLLPPRTALLAANDATGVMALREIRAIGRAVPEDLVVLGVDNNELACELTHPALSSIDINTQEMGLQASGLLKLILQEPLPENRRRLLIHPKAVVERRSTDSLAVEDPRLRRALLIIRERACEWLTVAELLQEVHMSRRALETGFKSAFGLTLQQQIDRVRVARACALLVETRQATPDIAAACGWPSASQMCKTFRRHTGKTPTEFRRKA